MSDQPDPREPYVNHLTRKTYPSKHAAIQDERDLNDLNQRVRALRGDYGLYAYRVDEALPLLKECYGELVWDGEAWHVEAFGYLYASNDNPARAICEVWLQWKRSDE
jgi:hypothetical protein